MRKAVHEREFRNRKTPLYTIAACPGDDPANPVVIAGMTSVAGTEPAIRLDVADVQLVYAYFYRAAFEGKTTCYTPIVDRMYEKVLKEFGIEE